ncbi:hypothetical protein U1Q18_040391, partial [Sarracenia purpurea var. burkii]
MECLEHTCTEGYMSVGPADMVLTEKRGSPSSKSELTVRAATPAEQQLPARQSD